MSLIDNLNDNKLARLAFGWNYKSWSHAFKVANFQLPNKVGRILEVGAGEFSAVSLIFDGLASEIIISYYSDEQREAVAQYLASVSKRYDLKSKYVLEQKDATTVEGSFDIVIMKSVLGGVFREDRSSLADVKDFIVDLTNRAVDSGGVLISIDNGKSVFERFLSRLGARRNQWRFFRKSDLDFATTTLYFGVFSFFSLETRLGILGAVLDNHVVYPLDCLCCKMWSHNPTVIVSTFDKAKRH